MVSLFENTTGLKKPSSRISESCAKFLEWLAELAEISWKFPRSLRSLSLTHTCPVCLSILFHTGDIQVLEKCTQLASVDFSWCKKITGGCCSEERSSQSCGPVPTLCWNFLAASLALNFLLFEQRTRRITRHNQSRHLRRPLRSGKAQFRGHEI